MPTVKNQELPLAWGITGKSVSDGNLEAKRTVVIVTIILCSLVSIFP